jgi:hypothetical protein
MDEEG